VSFGFLPLGLVAIVGFTSVLSGAELDLSRPPDRESLVAVVRAGRLAAFRDELGDALAFKWQTALNGDSGSSCRPVLARWIDLYQWIDLLESEEAPVTKRWLSRHLSAQEEKTSAGDKVQIIIHQPGSPLVHRYDELQHRATEQLTRDPVLMERVMDQLVAKPFIPRNGPLIGRLDPAFVEATVTDPEFLNRWSSCFREDDFAPKFLLNLQEIWKAHPQDWREFLNLALALSVVMDQPPPEFWPHHQVNQRDLPKKRVTPSEAFGQWVNAFRSGRLREDPRILDVGKLKFVVDAPIDPSELEWVRGLSGSSHGSAARKFFSITYDKSRMEKHLFVWPWGRYSLSSIRTHGGICVDQAYYAAISGKAEGIPTVFFCGEGNEGGHAWVGQWKGPAGWDLRVGRYEGQNFATGEALDPQNWIPITDHDLELAAKRSTNSVNEEAARRDLVMAWNFRRRGNAEDEGKAILSALHVCPENPDLWDAKEDWLMRTGSSPRELRAHHEAAIRQFSNYRDLKTQHEEALVRLSLASGDRNHAVSLSERIIHENLGKRSDLSADAAGTLISSQIAAGDINAAVEEFYRQLIVQGGHGGGEFFSKVTLPLALELIRRGSMPRARYVISRTYWSLKPQQGSPLDIDLRNLWVKAGGSLQEVRRSP
jgi:hypothetical protein